MQNMQASIAEAVRASKAMEGIATAMASNVESVRESVGISKAIATTQQLAMELQSRPNLCRYSFAMRCIKTATMSLKLKPSFKITATRPLTMWCLRPQRKSFPLHFPIISPFHCQMEVLELA